MYNLLYRIESGKMKETNVNRIVVISTFVIFAIAMIFVTQYVTTYNKNSNAKFFKNYNTIENNELLGILNKQDAMDERINDISENGDYTFANPCIIVNPYDISPLSAIIIFNTKSFKNINVSINDKFIYTTEKSRKHIIPIYGLFANSNNVITLEMDGEETTLDVQTSSYNFDTSGIKVKEYLGDKTHYFMVGNQLDKTSNIRGFDENNNLLFYLDLDYISSARFYVNRFYVGYNAKYSRGNNLQDIRLEIDYLGKILSITSELSDLDSEKNLDIEGSSFIGTALNLYSSEIPNYVIKNRIDQVEYTPNEKIITNDIADSLDEAPLYDKEFQVVSNGEYISFDFEEKNAKLMLVNKTSKYTYEYNVKDTNIIKHNISGNVSLYLDINGTYYSLLTTLKN